MLNFHPLKVTAVERIAEDAACVTLQIPSALRDAYAFHAGQYVTVRRMIEGREERRTYSIVTAPGGEELKLGIRHQVRGRMSGDLAAALRAGDMLEVGTPMGRFRTAISAERRHSYVAFAAGSGITPILSIAGSVLAANDGSAVTLLYGNRRNDSVMFADEIADLKDAYPARVCLVHLLSREPQEVELFNGRLDAAKLRSLLPVTVEAATVDHWWLCGPFGMVEDAISVLTGLGVARDRIHRELFYVEEEPPAEAKHAEAPAGPGAEVTVLLDGRGSTATVEPGTPILDGAQQVRPDLPFACKGGVCGTCRALLVKGEVTMRRNYALEREELEAGYVLTCQSLPVSDQITVDYDA